MASAAVQINVRLTVEQHRQLLEAANGTTITAIVREAITAYLEKGKSKP